MSLESKIENLTAAVQALTELIQKNVTYNATLIESSPAAKTETPKEAPATTPAVTVEKLHELCMEKSRANPDNRDKIKAILATYNAKTLKTLSTDANPAVYQKVNPL
ncbi:MAG: hypothetical protein JHC38_08515 [Thiotrichales bacterium]|nr:hypothetical protein [Thiotrichales bacterium]